MRSNETSNKFDIKADVVIPIAIGIVTRQGSKVISLKVEIIADVVKLVDTPDLGSGAERCAGSSPSIRTKRSRYENETFFVLSGLKK